MTEINGFQKGILGFLIVLLLQGIHSLHMEGDVTAPIAVLFFGVASNLVSDLPCPHIIQVGSFVSGLVPPSGVKHTFVTPLLTFGLQFFGDFGELLTVVGADKLQHLGLQFHHGNVVFCR